MSRGRARVAVLPGVVDLAVNKVEVPRFIKRTVVVMAGVLVAVGFVAAEAAGLFADAACYWHV